MFACTNATFDYVVVGGGTAGLTIATRLAQNGSYSVAVIEAGGFYELENGNNSQIPALAFLSTNTDSLDGVNPLIDWLFETTPQPGAGGRVIHYARGKTLGGTSARNYLNFNRPTIGAMQKWADTVGDNSYLWNNILPYYKKSVQFTPPNKTSHNANTTIKYDLSAWSSDGGPLQVSYPNYIYAVGSWMTQAFAQLGSYTLNGFNSGCLIGSSYTSHTENPADETRSSSQSAFLTLAMQETDLIVYTHTLTKKVLFNSQKKATGVLAQAGGVNFAISANKEVILSAGTFQSPQLLMVSGIGPASTLKAHNISLLADRPGVGQNMWDNVLFGVTHEVNLETTSILSSPAYFGLVNDYLTEKTGPLTNVGSDWISYDRISNQTWSNISASTRTELASTFPPDWPEAEWIANSLATGGAPDNGNYATLSSGLLALVSHGNISISSSDMADAPIVNPNWLADPVDKEIAIAALKRSRQIWAMPALQKVILGPELAPGANITTDAQILDWIGKNLQLLYHAAGTCAMGKVNDTMTVVDSKARVIGVQGLRVVDASSFPFLPPGQPQATVYMLAEKIAEDVLFGKS
ncbi:hypothetical protein LTR86_004067 [Recurvomyces mirabilis]|nr:hypothetical protein LTR86_004067 [Recurvomyces mirabilis]